MFQNPASGAPQTDAVHALSHDNDWMLVQVSCCLAPEIMETSRAPIYIYICIYVLYTHIYNYIVSHTVVSLIDETY